MKFNTRNNYLVLLILLCLPTSYHFAQPPSKATGEWQTHQTQVVGTGNGQLAVQIAETPEVKITEIYELMAKGQQFGIRILMPEADLRVTGAEWIRFMKGLGAKTSKMDDVVPFYFADNAFLPTVSENTIDIYTYIEAHPNGTVLKSFYDLGGAYISSGQFPDKYQTIASVMGEFGKKQVIANWKSQLEIAEKELQALSKERNTIKNNQETLTAQLEQTKKDLAATQFSLSTTQKALEAQNQTAIAQISKVEQLKFDLNYILHPDEAVKMVTFEEIPSNTTATNPSEISTFVPGKSTTSTNTESYSTTPVPINTAASVSYMQQGEKDMITEINLLRSNPSAYIPYIEQHIAAIESGQRASEPDEVMLARELINQLRSSKPLPLLQPHQGLYFAAKNHGSEMRAKAMKGHRSIDGAYPWDRILKIAPDLSDGNENLVGGASDIREAIVLLLIDAGIPDRGHRRNLLNPSWEYVAVYYVGDVGDMSNNWVQNFGKK